MLYFLKLLIHHKTTNNINHLQLLIPTELRCPLLDVYTLHLTKYLTIFTICSITLFISSAFPNSGFGSSSAQANANAFNQQFGPNGFGASAANAGAQSFFSQGPGGGFGASAANSASQGFQAGPGGITVWQKIQNFPPLLTHHPILQGSAGQSGSQTYHLPGNRDVSLAYTGGFSVADGKPSVSQGNSISFSG